MEEKKEIEKKVISPFEYAIRSVAEPETLHEYREETFEERKERLTKKFKEFFKNIKVKS